jgi:Tfp pilus assembly protein FimT
MELLLVLALLAMAVALAAPALSRFYRGRALDSEARRLLALTRYAQSRAVAEGVPMVVWFKPEEAAYGLQAEAGGTAEAESKSVRYELDPALSMEPASGGASPWKLATQIGSGHAVMRFTPDGYISDTSPEWVEIRVARTDTADAVRLALDENHLRYELQPTP